VKDYVGLDFETYGEVDLPKHGLQRYVNSPHFRPLIAALVQMDGVLIEHRVYEFINLAHYNSEVEALRLALKDKIIVAHNAIFEQAVLARMGIYIPSDRFVDSAVIARAMGAAGKLEAAAPQLLGIDKMASGWDLIKLFSMPKEGQLAFDPQIVGQNLGEWDEFARYCILDAELSLRLADEYLDRMSTRELANAAVTMDMNNTGWHVDMDLVRNMQLRYLTNVANAEADFRKECDAEDLNLNSTPQLKEWCAARGVRATSFDEAHVEKLLTSIQRKLDAGVADAAKRAKYLDVRQLLWTKQIMGGSSLKKLQTIIDTTGTDGRLHDQYLHIGAGATYRTTGRGVQMQNLKRLNGEGNDMSELWVEDVEWDNGKLASNLRQVFTATDPNGFLIVGDFSSVESRGLAWQAGEQWKIDAYFQGQDLYKVQAGKIFGKHHAHVTKPERQIGKVGELACGYGAGPDAVKDFAAKMGVVMTEVESAKLVRDWRGANPEIVDYWRRLDDALQDAVDMNVVGRVSLPHGFVKVTPMAAPQSLRDQVRNQGLVSLRIQLYLHDNHVMVDRVIHGTRLVGRNIHYWKPSERKTGDLWVDTWMNPKTKRQQPFSVYGGKLSGLLTQSLCREVFFDSLRDVHNRLSPFPGVNVQLVGQFHDEIVLDWAPGAVTLEATKRMLNDCMSRTILPEFPLAADIKSDYRYTK
jgi:DNA polymerase bacteriophage-type